MRRNTFLTLIALALIAAIGWQIRSGYAIPPSITISGALKGPDGKPLAGSYAAEVKFYKSQSDTDPVDTRSATVQVVDGVFSLSLIPDASLLDAEELWYTLAIDSDGDGIGTADLFPDRFQVTSVPYALTAKPVKYFNSHGGLRTGGGISFGTSPTNPANKRMFVSPFVTPPGGVQFNRMCAWFGVPSSDTWSNFSYGVYDRTGHLLYSSGPISYGSSVAPLRSVGVSNGYLEPSTKYYTGWTFGGETSPQILETHIGAVPDTGYVGDFDYKGVVPETFYSNQIVYRFEGALNITFEMIENETVYGTSNSNMSPEIQQLIDAK